MKPGTGAGAGIIPMSAPAPPSGAASGYTTAAYYGYLGWNHPVWAINAGQTLISGTKYVSKLWVPVAGTAANIVLGVNTAGASFTAAGATTVAAGSNGQNVNALTSGNLAVAATAGFAAAGTLVVATDAGNQLVSYTSTSGGNTFTGCTSLGSGLVSTGGAVSQPENLCGLYNAAGTLLAVTGDQAAVWNTTGPKSMALTAINSQSLAIAANSFVLVEFLSVATTVPKPAGFFGNALLNNGLTAAQATWTTNGTAQTSIDQSITPGGLTVTPLQSFIAVS